MMKPIKPIYLSLLSGLLLYIAWPPFYTYFILLIGFVPLLLIHEQLKNSKKKHLKFWAWSYLSLFIFNVGSTWWVWNASESGAVIMLVLNSLILSIPFFLFSLTQNTLPKTGYQSLVFYYLAMEYFHFNWSASWPWLTLGKGLARGTEFIQWYEFTGEMGGTLLILLANILITKVIISKVYKNIWHVLVLLVLTVGLSYAISFSHFNLEKGSGIHCVVVQPNIDPYEEKFESGSRYMSPEEQINQGINIAKPLIKPKTRLLIFPETAIVGYNNIHQINQSSNLSSIKQLTDSNSLMIISGAESYETYDGEKKRPTISARYEEDSELWWDAYNTALSFKEGKVSEYYHKSKLVPGVEKMPFSFLEQLSIDLGGTSGSLGTSKKPINFQLDSNYSISPLICYESIYGDYVADFVRQGANMLAVITNDAWWGNTDGHKQHLLFGAIRCIETRKEMVRSANTGISAKINKFGEITTQTKYNELTAFECNIRPNNIQTFYVKYGNILGKMASFIAIALLLGTLVKLVAKKGY